jgi:hypothetical protein
MGGLRGNVYLKVDGYGTPLQNGVEAINRFVFKGHWTLKVNNVVYDPIFRSIGENNVEWILDSSPKTRYMADNGSRFIPDQESPSENGEFGATFIWVTDWRRFEGTVKNMEGLYTQKKNEVDGILAGTTTMQDESGDDRDSYLLAKGLVKNSVHDTGMFVFVAEVAYKTASFVTRSQVEAIKNIISLAAR